MSGTWEIRGRYVQEQKLKLWLSKFPAGTTNYNVSKYCQCELVARLIVASIFQTSMYGNTPHRES